MKDQHFDVVSVAVVDFLRQAVTSYELVEGKEVVGGQRMYFDLASLTKPLTVGLVYLRSPQWFTIPMVWLLNHQAGLPVGGRLPKRNWREIIGQFPLQYTPTSYSDFSAIRLQIMLEGYLPTTWEQYLSSDWGSQICFWRQLPLDVTVPISGQRGGRPINRQVHDHNCFNLQEFTVHAGLFASLQGLADCLLRIDQRYQLLDSMEKQVGQQDQRFIGGWDTSRGLPTSLAGKGSGKLCFGHLGFTGTSIWIDPERKLGQIILTNATKNYWYHREGLNSLRRNVGTWIWEKGGF